MEQPSSWSRATLPLFAAAAMAIYAAAIAIAGVLPALPRPQAVAFGLAVDLVVVVPVAFYFLVLRRRGLPFVAIAPIVVLGFLAAAWILPADHQQPLRILEFLAVPLELALVVWIARRATRALRSARRDASADPLRQLQRAAVELLHDDRAASVLATEVAVLYYALGAWRAPAHVPSGAIAFSHHRRSGHGGVLVAFLLVLLVEGLAVHFLVALWSQAAAWIFSAGTVYTALWLFADYRATTLRPILVTDRSVCLRAGLRWSLEVSRTRIAALSATKPDLGKDCLGLTFLGTPSHWITFSDPIEALGPYGLKRRVRAVGIQPDEDFARALRPAS